MCLSPCVIEKKGSIYSKGQISFLVGRLYQVIAQCNTFLLAGQETTANALAFAVYCLCTNSDVQDKLTDEVDTFFNADDKKLTHESLCEVSNDHFQCESCGSIGQKVA